MGGSKLVVLFKNLSAWEIRNLETFLQSPFFNKREDVILLFNYLEQETEKNSPHLSKEKAFQFVFPNTAFDSKKIVMLMSQLFRLIEQFLAFSRIKDNETLVKMETTKAYRERNMEANFIKTYKDVKRIAAKKPYRDFKYLHLQYELELEYYHFIGSQIRLKKNNLQAVTNTLEAFIIASYLKQSCLMLAHQTVYEESYHTFFLKELITLLENNPHYLEFPAISVYYNYYKTITDSENEVHFKQLRDLIQKHFEKFKRAELRDIYLAAINYCIKRLNTGNPIYLEESFKLYQFGFDNSVLLENNMITKYTYTNAVAIAIRLEKYSWTESFINNYKQNLPFKSKDNIFIFNLAKLRYAQKKYKETMKLLVQFNSEDLYHNLISKTLLLKIYYELNEYTPLEALLISSQQYLQRKNIISYHKAMFRNFFNILKELLYLSNSDRQSKEKLKQKVIDTPILAEKEWLLAQL